MRYLRKVAAGIYSFLPLGCPADRLFEQAFDRAAEKQQTDGKQHNPPGDVKLHGGVGGLPHVIEYDAAVFELRRDPVCQFRGAIDVVNAGLEIAKHLREPIGR